MGRFMFEQAGYLFADSPFPTLRQPGTLLSISIYYDFESYLIAV
jgi:hypothetical protein